MRSLLVSLVPAAAFAPLFFHLSFSVLPCPLLPYSTVDVVGCQEHRVLRTDRAIDAQAKTILGLLRTEGARSSFVAGGRSWLHYRRRLCSAEASRTAGGTAHAVALLDCPRAQPVAPRRPRRVAADGRR